ncbi:MAG: nucleotide pyrophosphohydrolase [Nanoarchaeota archaeon]|nr:nucleotide pyrophosphohydrolase [Nanoarchaeota archaeon]
MPIKNYQNEVDEWVKQFDPPYWKPHEILARLTEEVGELAREVNHIYGPKKKKASESERELADEIGDIMFTLICLANSHGFDLDDVMNRVLEKSRVRDKDRFEKKEF